jgi:hypothetical protein
MTNSILKRIVGLTAAASTTLVLFTAVVALADDDKAALVAAKSVRGNPVAQATTSVRR